MKIEMPPGTYVVAVSGGVDSVVLLHLLLQQKNLSLVVAHFDHGMRLHSAKDANFVADLSRKHSLQFETERVELGVNTSEAIAREHRYAFLRNVRRTHNAAHILTAHHQDDLIETIIHNLLRGTGRRGITSLASNAEVVRPLLAHPKSDIVSYAQEKRLSWREDGTNNDVSYTRNWIRHKLIPKLSKKQRDALLAMHKGLKQQSSEIDTFLSDIVPSLSSNRLEKSQFTLLPHAVAAEALVAWLRNNGVRNYDRKIIHRLINDIKTKKPGTRIPLSKSKRVLVEKQSVSIES